jgi:Ser/Thr protein kinase RdoA (MazF antagonist)
MAMPKPAYLDQQRPGATPQLTDHPAPAHAKHDWPAVGQRIAIAALPRFGIEPDSSMTLLPQSENLALHVTPHDRPAVVVRVSPPNARTPDEVCSELAWINALGKESDAPVPAVHPATSGDAVVTVTDPITGVTACVAVFEHVTGHEPEDDELAALMPKLGRISAELHEHASAWVRPTWFTRKRWDADAAFGPTPHWGSWQAGVPDPDHRHLLSRMENVIIRRLQRFGQGPERFGLVHADLRTANLLVHGESFHVIDFDDSGFSWWLYDLATAMTFYENHPQRDELVGSWVESYRQVRTLPETDEAEILTFLAFRRLLTLAFLGNTPDVEVTRAMLPGMPEQTCELAEEYLTQFG